MLLSICIPSYNRGHRAYPMVKKMLEEVKDYDVDIVLSNNGSNKNIEGYEKLKKIKNEKFHYYEFDKNMRFWRNYNQVVQKAEGEWCLILSDEDSIDIHNLEYYLNLIRNNKKISVVKAAGDDYPFDDEGEYEAGLEAIQQFFLAGNYISGTMYRRSIVNDGMVEKLAEKYGQNNKAYYYYPHLFLELLALIEGDFYRCDKYLIIKGESIIDQETSSSQLFTEAAYQTFESRLLQFEGFTQFIAELETTEAIKMKCFKMLIEKYVLMLYICRTSMRDHAIGFMEKQICNTNSSLILENKDDFSVYIKELCEKIL